MRARRLTTILPAMTLAEAIETTRIHRVAGLTGDRTALVTTRPCRARSCGNRSRTASSIYNLASVLDVAGLALLVDHVHGGTG
jgi:hypothetical protein